MKKNQSKKLWFKRWPYRWLYIPVTWQGVLSVVVFLVVLFVAILQLPRDDLQPSTGQMIAFLSIVAADLIFLIAVIIVNGSSPRIHLSKGPDDDPEENL